MCRRPAGGPCAGESERSHGTNEGVRAQASLDAETAGVECDSDDGSSRNAEHRQHSSTSTRRDHAGPPVARPGVYQSASQQLNQAAAAAAADLKYFY